MRARERKVFEDQGLIKTGKIELEEAVDMRGTCERMCSEYERRFREFTREIHPFEYVCVFFLNDRSVTKEELSIRR